MVEICGCIESGEAAIAGCVGANGEPGELSGDEKKD